jgi:hypothetical protein
MSDHFLKAFLPAGRHLRKGDKGEQARLAKLPREARGEDRGFIQQSFRVAASDSRRAVSGASSPRSLCVPTNERSRKSIRNELARHLGAACVDLDITQSTKEEQPLYQKAQSCASFVRMFWRCTKRSTSSLEPVRLTYLWRCGILISRICRRSSRAAKHMRPKSWKPLSSRAPNVSDWRPPPITLALWTRRGFWLRGWSERIGRVLYPMDRGEKWQQASMLAARLWQPRHLLRAH